MLIISSSSYKTDLNEGRGFGAYLQVRLSEEFYGICKKGFMKAYMLDSLFMFPHSLEIDIRMNKIQMHLMNAFKWINEREFLFFTRIIFIIWIIEVTKE